ncbi:DUF3105 domain-containing protein [Cohnella endophytica]|uniref:DUF3105 domain-containing protein n=1 Tax=Cohnella endophytica TaxID=2419778 RepID=A0A494Y5W5_9BACL|nr:DUF3105 domain-containing protein [Cohnella endophytica]RKP58069.1 DUF3105 domain-containing protein [Cohnella endophytica]
MIILATLGAILLAVAVMYYWSAAKTNRENTSQLKKDQKAQLKKKHRKTKNIAHALLGAGIIMLLIPLLQNAFNKYDLNSLNADIAIDVKTDKDYGRGHTEMPVDYEMKIPTSGTHSPHDLKFGFYEEKPATEMLVHNLEHGDIEINYRPNASKETLDSMRYLTHFTRAGAGVLAIPNEDIPEGKEVVVTAWTKTMELTKYDEKQIGVFMYEFMNKGPEQIPANIRRGGGTM